MLFGGKQGGFRPGLSENKSGEGGGSAPTVFPIISYMVSLVLCRNLSFAVFHESSLTFGGKDSDAFCPTNVALTHCRTVTLSLCQYQLLGSEQKGVLFDCNPTHLSLESGAFSLWLRRHNDILCLGKARRRLTSVTLHAS